MISKGLFEMAMAIRSGENYSLNTMRDAVILGLTYVTGARPVQLAKLAVKDLRIDTRNSETGLIRYSLLLPYAKQRHLTTERLFLAIPAEIGALIRHYIEQAQLKPDGKLFEFSHSAPFNVSRAINKAILCFSPPDYQAAVARGEAALPTITPTDLRHNVGHSLAMQGVSAEEIAHILGHSSLTVAKYYILATPALALIRAKALGINPVWQNMVAMMLTGEMTSSTKWQDQIGFRKSKGLTQRELSARLGVTQQTYARLEANPSKASFERLYKVLNILGVEISLSSAPLSTYKKPANFVEKEFDSPARREEW